MALIADAVLDTALNVLTTNGDTINICSSEPANFAGIAGVNLGNATVTTGAPQNGDTDGRKVVVGAISTGSVTGNGTATHWALSNGTDALYATGSLTASQTVTNGNTFTLDAISITLRDAT